MTTHPRRLLAPALAAALSAGPACSATLVVSVVGVQDDAGFVGCALFAAEAAASFPLEPARAITRRAPARAGTLQCEFTDLPAGTYAVSAAHDRNGNGKTDRNFVGLPTEPWAVSNNVRPTLRAPAFAEGAFALAADEIRRIELVLAR
jgi:uncharacterized protein (DUF2141 family)